MVATPRDNNRIPILVAVLDTDGTTITPVKGNPATTYPSLKVADATTGTDHGPTDAARDENRKPILMAVSAADGVTPVPIYADSNGALLIRST